MLVVGLCGGIGAGKSTVAGLLADLGAVVVDVDDIGHRVLTDDAVRDAVVAEFGDGILGADGAVDRASLAAEVFGDTDRLPDLEAISHPCINRELDRLLTTIADSAERSDVVVLDMAVLVESDLGRLPDGRGYTEVVVVEADRDTRLARLLERGMSSADALGRMADQADDAQRRAVADHVITNDGDVDSLVDQVAGLWKALLSEG